MKKSQIQMMETISVLIIFIIIVTIGLVVYYNFAKSSIKQKEETRSDLSSIQIAQIVSTLPEIQCSEQNILKDNCIDLLKLNLSANYSLINKTNYFHLFGFSRISVSDIFPKNTFNITLYNLPYNNSKNIMPKTIPTYVPISIYNPNSAKQETYFGILTIEVYS